MRIWVRREARSACMSFQLLSLGKTCMRTMGERDGGVDPEFVSHPNSFAILFLTVFVFHFKFSSGDFKSSLDPFSAQHTPLPCHTPPPHHPAPCEPGQILPTEHDETLEPSVCPLRYPPALLTDLSDRPGTRRKIPERQNEGKGRARF